MRATFTTMTQYVPTQMSVGEALARGLKFDRSDVHETSVTAWVPKDVQVQTWAPTPADSDHIVSTASVDKERTQRPVSIGRVDDFIPTEDRRNVVA